MAGTARNGATHSGNEPIAIIGSGCRFPGGSNSPSKLWDLLHHPRNVATEIPSSRFNPEGHYHPNGQHHGTSNVRESYLLSEDIRLFDAQFFGVKGVEANSIDPQQRLLLETVYEGVESAGLQIEKLRGSNTAVYVGLMCGDYSDMMTRDPDHFPMYFATGTARSILSNRVSYFFDWHGPSMTIDTACSSSLIALHQAVQILRSGESRVAVAAGSNLIIGPEPYIAESKLKMLSPTGRSRMWDSAADGYARGDGVAAVVLKTLSAALADGDHIECLIRETGTNHDGRTKGITMPSPIAQMALIHETYAKAGLDLSKKADRPQYFEAHGTGTPTGDPIEAEAISRAFFGPAAKYRTPRKSSGGDTLYVGSIKTVIGHTEGTAGLAAVLKASLALQHKIIPPNMLLNRLNPAVIPFYENLEVPTSAMAWPEVPKGPRRVSVNSFGFGGSNAHAILESWDPSSETALAAQIPRKEPAFLPFLFSANSERTLSELLAAYEQYLIQNPATNLRDLSWTLAYRRSKFPVRAVLTGATVQSLQGKLLQAVTDPASVTITRGAAGSGVQNPKVLGVFTGQGAQWAMMGRELLLESPAAAKIMNQLDQHLADLPAADRPSWSLRSEILADAKSSRLNQAALSQPLCTAIQIVLVDLLHAAGIQFNAVVGHSSGEIGAAYAAGYVDARDAIRIAYYRGVHAKLAGGPHGQKGAMVAAGTSMEDATELCDLKAFRGRVCVAASNSSTSVTLSGDTDAIDEIVDVLEEEKKFARRLKVDTAYHSHHMLRCSDAYINSLKECNIQIRSPSTTCTWISSVYGAPTESIDDDLTSTYWNNNMVRPVLFSQAVECAIGEEGPFDAVIEVGPHPALKGPASQTIQEISGDTIPYTGVLSRGKNAIETMADALGFISTHLGEKAVDFTTYDRFASSSLPPKIMKDLPAYPWDHDRQYWHPSRTAKAYRERDQPYHDILGFPCADNTEREMRWKNILIPKELPWLYGHQIQGQMVFPGAGYVSAAVEAVNILAGNRDVQLVEVYDITIGQAVIFDDEDSSVETLFTLTEIETTANKGLTANFAFYSSASADSLSMTLNSRGRLEVVFGSPSDTALPSRNPDGFNLIDVPDGRFYESLDELGFEYSREFRNLRQLRRKLGVATGAITNPPTGEHEKRLLVHPATLDGAIQSIILAYCWPGDGRLRSIHVPVNIRRIRVNLGLCQRSAGKELLLPFDSSLGSNAASEIDGDVDLFTPDGQHCMLQVEGMKAVPFSEATAADDFHLFSELVWGPVGPNSDCAPSSDRATTADYDLALIMERIAYYYTRVLHKSITPAQVSKSDWHHEHLFRWGKIMLQRVEDGTDLNINKEWDDDTHSDIVALIAQHPDSIDLKVMREIGENMPAVVRGETTILEHLMKDNLLNDYYVNALGFHQYTLHLGRMIGQIAHRYPHMNILEIGAGTGGATKAIFKEIESTFSSYTYTDISSGFFEKAQDVFSENSDKMVFKVLNAEHDIADQGFTEQSYDLIVASLVIHATATLEETLKNARRLLKPGGYLVMLEITNNDLMRLGFIFGCLSGWWLGVDDKRTMSPCISTSQWDDVLRRTGFAGVEATTPDNDILPFPLSVICAQAVDDRVMTLKHPLSSTTPESIQAPLVVVGGNTPKTAVLLERVRALCPQRSITHRVSLDTFDIENSQLNGAPTVLSLVDLDDPTFKTMTSKRLQGLKVLFEQSKSVLWVTQGARHDDPYANMIVGFGRCILLEMPHVRLQFLDIETSSDPDPHFITEALLRFETTRIWEEKGEMDELLWSIEPEIALEQGRELIPRLKLNKLRNSRYNSFRRQIIESVDPKTAAVRITPVGSTFTVEGPTFLSLQQTTKPGHVRIQVSHSILQPFKVPRNGNDFVYLVLGRLVTTGRQVLTFVHEQMSIVEVPEKQVITCPQDIKDGVHFMSLVAVQLTAFAMLMDLAAGQTLLVHEPPVVLADSLSRLATESGIQVVYLTAKSDKVERPWIRIHNKSSQKVLKSSIPLNAASFVDMSENENLTAQILACLPSSCKVSGPFASPLDGAQPGSDNSAYSTLTLVNSFLFRSRLESSPASITDMPTLKLSDIPQVTLKDRRNTFSIIDWNAESTVSIKVRPIDNTPLFKADRTYWLVGLTGGLGQSLCRWMVQHGAKYVVLSSRNPKVDPRWAEHMESMGAVVKIIANDITNWDAAKVAYNEICATLPPLAGVAQGAMVLNDSMFLETTMESMQKALGPKVNGSVHLQNLVQDKPLDFFVFFSSMAAVTGNAGQSIYAAANMFMTGLAAQRRKRGLAGSVINIGAIIGNGYVTREVSQAQQNALRNYGNTWMSEQDFHQIFAEGVVASLPTSKIIPDIATGLRLVNADGNDTTTWFTNPKFQNLVIEEGSSEDKRSTSKSGVPVRVRLLEAVTEEDVKEILKETFIAKLQVMLQLGNDEEKTNAVVNLGADELGIDSLVAVEIRSWFIKELNVDVPVLKILGGATIGDLLVIAQEKLPAALVPNLGADPTTVPKRSEPVAAPKKVELNPKPKKAQFAPKQQKAPLKGKDPSPPQPKKLDRETTAEATTPQVPSDIPQVSVIEEDVRKGVDEPKNTSLRETESLPSFATPPMEQATDEVVRDTLAIHTENYQSNSTSSRQSVTSEVRDSRDSSFPVTSSASSISLNERENKDQDIRDQLLKKSPMSFGQSRFWFLRHFLEDQTTFNITCSIRLEGKLRVDDFDRAVRVVAERHEALRTCFFVDENEQLMQGVLRNPTLRLQQKSITDEREIITEHDRVRNHVFDIERGENMIILLLSLSATSHQIIVGYHHINMDGISLEVLLAELQKAYSQESLGNQVLQYSDFSGRQRGEYAEGRWNDQLAFWKEEYPDSPPPLPLLSLSQKTSRSPLVHYAFESAEFQVDKSLATRIQDTCRRLKATPFHFYLATYKALLSRFTDAQDFCIGIADGNRNDSDTTEAIGFYLNLLPLRFRVQDRQAFSDALKEAKTKAYNALANSRVPFDVVLSEIGIHRTAAHNPLFQAFINYRQGVKEHRPFCDCSTHSLAFESGRTSYDVNIDVIDYADGDATVKVMVQSQLYSQEDAEVLGQCYVNLLDAYSRNAALRLDRPALFNPTQVQEALELGQGPIRQSQWPKTMVHRIDDIVHTYGSHTAVRDGLGNSLTYTQLASRADSIATALTTKKINAGARVGVFQEPSTDWISSLVAIWKLGAVYVPIDPRSLTARQATIVSDCKPDAILVDAANLQNASSLKTESHIINVSPLAQTTQTVVPIRAGAEMPAVIAYTSGSTGTPKGIVLKHSSIINNTEWATQQFDFKQDTVLQQSSLSFDMSLSQICIALANGGSLYILPQAARGDSALITNIINSEGISFTQATPSEYISWLRHGSSQLLQSSKWRVACSGGEQANDLLLNGFRALRKPDLRLFSGYGPTEITFTSNSLEVSYTTDRSNPETGRIPAGFTWPNYSVYIVDDHLQPVPVGVPGEIVIGGAGVASGYHNNPDMTKQRFIPDVFGSVESKSRGWTVLHRTGDRGRLQRDGALVIEGRIAGDTQIKLRGIRIDLREIENTIAQASNGTLLDVVVSLRKGESDETKYLVAHATFSPAHPVAERAGFLNKLLSQLPLPQYMRPALIIPLDKMPMNSSSKLDRLAIAQLPLSQAPTKNSNGPSALTEIETRLKETWEEVLPVEIANTASIDSNTDFFSVGGSSLLLVKLRTHIQRNFDVELPLVQLFEASTLGGMAAKLGHTECESDVEIQQPKVNTIDWEYETQLPPALSQLDLSPPVAGGVQTPKTVVLTGATGFVGRSILQQLLDDERIEKVHCIAVRHSSNRLAYFSSPKLVVHSGDLTLPRLGLSEAEANSIFKKADAVIHNGADVSFLKTYRSLKQTNVDSTKELLRLSLPRRAQFHYISSASIAQLSDQDVFEPVTAAPYLPTVDGTDGYTTTKWVNERLLERVAERFDLPVFIHRASSIIGEDAPATDIMSNLLGYSRRMHAVPSAQSWQGYFDFISVDYVARDVVGHLFHAKGSPANGVRYLHHSGELEIPASSMKEYLEKETGRPFEELSMTEWAARAREHGLDEMVAAYLGMVASANQAMKFPRLLRNDILVRNTRASTAPAAVMNRDKQGEMQLAKKTPSTAPKLSSVTVYVSLLHLVLLYFVWRYMFV